MPGVSAASCRRGPFTGRHFSASYDHSGIAQASRDVISIEHALSIVEPWITSYGIFALFFAIYLESFGAPLPSESAIVAGTAIAVRGDLSIVSVAVTAWSAAVLGDTTGYFFGRRGGQPLLKRFGSRFGLTPQRFKRLSGEIRQHGFVMVMLARFVWGLRQFNGLIAGTLSMPVTRFLPANTVGAALWVGAWTVGTYIFAAQAGL
jgi:membrane protein DedA with SNARE-associated domain